MLLHLIATLIYFKHISLTCHCCCYHIRDLRRIFRYISFSVAKTTVTTLITSWLDDCNSHFYNNASMDIQKLQYGQNCLARVVTRSSRFSHSVPLLKSFHGLPVHSRIISSFASLPIKLFFLENLHIYCPGFL